MNENKQNFEELIKLFQSTHIEMQKRVAKSVDISLVVRNWLFGWYIVEFEQGNATRKELYGTKLMPKLAKELKLLGLKGTSLTNLKKFRFFYSEYKQIGQALPDQSLTSNITLDYILQALPAKCINKIKIDSTNIGQALPAVSETFQKMVDRLASSFALGWTHYVTLLTISDKNERKFYEIETVNNSWGYRELERQINSSD